MHTTNILKSAVVSVDGPVAGAAIACDAGAAWITQCCDPTDHFLAAGKDFSVRREGKIVVQILRDGKISIRFRNPSSDEFMRRFPTSSLRAWNGVKRRWRRLIQRGSL